MKRSSLIGHIIELHDAICSSKLPADIIIKEFFKSRHYLGAKDRRFISEVVYGLVRNYKLIQAYAAESARTIGVVTFPRNVPSILLIGVYFARIMKESPDAMLPDISGLWRVYLPEIDCRRFLESATSALLPAAIENDPLKSIATRFSMPEVIVREWIERYGNAEAESLCASLNSPAPITIRVNTLATTVAQCRATLKDEGIEPEPTTLSPFGLKLEKRVNTQALASFKRGYFEMQDEGSQLLSMLVGAVPGATIVDACAGGGGKTLHLGALMNNMGTLIAIDVDKRRLDNIRERVRRAGVSIADILLADRDQDAIHNWTGKANAVLIDAPCTGVGTFRRNPGAKLTFTDDFVDAVAKTQREVLERYSPLVKPGGRLVYSTCTLLKKENEDQVSWFLSEHHDFELVSAPEMLTEQGIRVESGTPFLSLLPHRTTTDGFFAAVMVRREFVDS
ncbi:MAG TPA: RNA methyltransferase [Bacteroidetes bacterium]|nr:RNA methyltransferase [Bacteroidota bacterium]